MKRKEPPKAVIALHQWRDRQRRDRVIAAEREDEARAKEEAARKRALRRERAAERQAELEAQEVSKTAAELGRQQTYYDGAKVEAEARSIVSPASIALTLFWGAGIFGAALTIYRYSQSPLPRSEAAYVALILIVVIAIALLALFGWFAFLLTPWLERKTDAGHAASALDRIARQRQALEDGAYTIGKSRRPFGSGYEIRFNDQKGR